MAKPLNTWRDVDYLTEELRLMRRERDIARDALIELLRGLAQDDELRRRAVETAMELVRSWTHP